MGRRLRWWAYGGAVLVAVAVWGAIRSSVPVVEEQEPSPVPTRKRGELAEFYARRDRLGGLYPRLPKPVEGDWLFKYPEGGQTFDQYVALRERPVRERYSEIHLLPLGEFSSAQWRVLQQTGEGLELLIGLKVRLLDRLPLENVPAEAQTTPDDGRSRKLLTRYLQETVLKPRLTDETAALLGCVADDLWPGPGWNWVFGEASLTERVGVVSLHRDGELDGDEAAARLYLLRSLKNAAHETGHMLGMPHCAAYECRMNGYNSRDELDRRPLEFCPECQTKLWWTCRIDPVERFARLIPFAERVGFADEARFWKLSAEQLSRAKSTSAGAD